MNKQYCKTQYTLQGTQPYVLTANWPKGFTPKQTYWKPDYSLRGVTVYNNVEKYYSVDYKSNICDKNEFKIK